MNHLSEELEKIYNFVNTDFDINDEEAIKAIKESLTIEKLEEFEEMLKVYKKAYKKAVNKLNRIEKQKEAQKNFKKIGTNLKLEEFEIYKTEAEKQELTISQYVKNALEAFLSSKTVEAIKVSEEEKKKPYSEDIERLKAENTKLKNELLEKTKNLENLQTLYRKNLETSKNNKKVHETMKENATNNLNNLKTDIKNLQEELENLKSRSFLARLFNF